MFGSGYFGATVLAAGLVFSGPTSESDTGSNPYFGGGTFGGGIVIHTVGSGSTAAGTTPYFGAGTFGGGIVVGSGTPEPEVPPTPETVRSGGRPTRRYSYSVFGFAEGEACRVGAGSVRAVGSVSRGAVAAVAPAVMASGWAAAVPDAVENPTDEELLLMLFDFLSKQP